MHTMCGCLLAILFPVTNTRHLPFQLESYYVHHFLIYLLPLYMLATNMYTMEPLNDLTWVSFTTGVNFLYHFLVLQGVGMVGYHML